MSERRTKYDERRTEQRTKRAERPHAERPHDERRQTQRAQLRSRAISERGIALLVTLLALGMFSALAVSLSLLSTTSRLLASNYDDSIALANAAESALALAARDLAGIADWSRVLSGEVRSGSTDGVPGLRTLADGSVLDLTAFASRLSCGRGSGCTRALLQARTADRPWGASNPQWQPFLYGSLASPALPRPPPPLYILVLVGDDEREMDGDPWVDGGEAGQDGRNMLRVRAEAFGQRGARAGVTAHVVRQCSDGPDGQLCAPGVGVFSWRPLAASGL